MKSSVANTQGRVLVTGAAGFIGRYLVPALLDNGWEVLALAHERSLPKCLKSDALQVIQGDINDLTLIRNAVSQVDAVCHLAGYIPPNYEDSVYAERCLQVNGLLTLRMAEFAVERHSRRFIFFSSGQAHQYSQAPVSENAPLYPVKRATYYLASKLVGELYLEHLRYLNNLPAITLRVASCYGFGMPEKAVVYRFMKCVFQGLPLQVWDDGIPTYDFVYVSDVVQLAVAALTSGDSGIYNVGSGRAYSVIELAQAVVDTFPEKEVPIDVKPPLDSIPASFPALSIEKAAKTWNYSPLSLKDGLAKLRKQMEQALSADSNL